MPLLSIITVCRNDAARLKKTVDSLNLFYDDIRFEHIVVDGDSADGTDVLIELLMGKNNFKFHSGRDAGIYDAMNRGASYSSSPFLLFLNCGDIMIASPNEVFDYLFPLAACNVPSVDIACFPVKQMGTTRSKIVAPVCLSLHKMPTSHQGMVFGRDFVLLNKYDALYKIAGDYDLYLQATKVAIISSDTSRPLTAVEVEGVASRNPMVAYREYLSIARNRLEGRQRLIAMFRIGLRALSVATLKLAFPRRWISTIRGV